MEGRDILTHLRLPAAARDSADMWLLLQCIGVSLSLVLRCLGEATQCGDFRALREDAQ